MASEKMLHGSGIRKISCAALNRTTGDSLAELIQGAFNTRFRPTINNNTGAFLEQAAGNAESNPGSRTGNKCSFSCKFEIQLFTDRYKFI